MVLVGLFAVAVGCNKTNTPTAGGDPNSDGSNAPAAALDGKQLFDQNCAKCHRVVEGEKRGKKGVPNLSKVGADPEHTPEWIAEHIRNPESHKPGSKMPPFEGKLSAEQIQSVADYLATMK
jgi:cytochrome c oxidase subunit 2